MPSAGCFWIDKRNNVGPSLILGSPPGNKKQVKNMPKGDLLIGEPLRSHGSDRFWGSMLKRDCLEFVRIPQTKQIIGYLPIIGIDLFKGRSKHITEDFVFEGCATIFRKKIEPTDYMITGLGGWLKA